MIAVCPLGAAALTRCGSAHHCTTAYNWHARKLLWHTRRCPQLLGAAALHLTSSHRCMCMAECHIRCGSRFAHQAVTSSSGYTLDPINNPPFRCKAAGCGSPGSHLQLLGAAVLLNDQRVVARRPTTMDKWQPTVRARQLARSRKSGGTQGCPVQSPAAASGRAWRRCQVAVPGAVRPP